jgi:hypothetical protein
MANGSAGLKEADLTSKTVKVTATNGSANLASAKLKGIAGNVTVTAQKDVDLEGAFVTGTVKELNLTSSEGALKLKSSSVGSDAKTDGSVLAESITLSAKGDINVGSDALQYTASVGSLDISGANLALQSGSSLKAAGDVKVNVSQSLTASDSVTVAADNAVKITSGVDTEFGNKARIEAAKGSIILDSKGILKAGSGFAVTSGTDAEFKAAKDLEIAASAVVTAGGSVSLGSDATVSLGDGAQITGAGVSIGSGSDTTLGKNAQIEATSGSVTLNSKGGINAGDDLSLKASEKITATASNGIMLRIRRLLRQARP